MTQNSQAPALLRVVSPADVQAAEDNANQQKAAIEMTLDAPVETSLAAHIRSEFQTMRVHRDSQNGWSERLIHALRTFNASYDPQKLQEIRQFGGSEVYANLTSMKCRGASSLLRDVYMTGEAPWALDPADDPDVPQEVIQSIQQLVTSETQSAMAGGEMPGVDMIRDRSMQLMEAARSAAKRKASKQAMIATDKMEEILVQGGFYRALSEVLQDLPMFPFACMKGPVVKVVPTVVWENGRAISKEKARLFWQRVSPFDIWFTPGVGDIEVASVIERQRLTRAEINDLLDIPGYNEEAVRAVLQEYGDGGLTDDWDSVDSERAEEESRENPHQNQSGLISCLEYHGNVQGKTLLEYGLKAKDIKDPDRDYFVQAWLVGRHVIKAQLSPSPRKRHPYFITSFEKVPGTPVGNALPDMLGDIQDVANATLRSLVNNLSIASGPQVVVMDDRLSPNEDGDELYPWKRWHVQSDPMSNMTQVPVSFFQPNAHAAELLGVYNAFAAMADEVSAIPKYMSGSGVSGGAGRTASGLAMLMSNASKILQTVASNIDGDILEPSLTSLYDMVMLTDESGVFTGQEQVRVRGVAVAVQRETQRVRQLEFLQTTANPIDMQIIGPRGRAEVLRSVSETIGLDGAKIVPSEDDLDKQEAQAAAQAEQQRTPGFAGLGEQAAEAQGTQSGPGTTADTGPRTRLTGGAG